MAFQVEIRRFDQADDQLDFHSHGRIDIVKLSDGTLGMRATLKPGWKWATDEKPLLGNPESCPMHHTGYCIAGELVVKIVQTGEVRRIREGDFFSIPEGHDAYVPGDQTCELILFQTPEAAVQQLAA